MKKWIIISLALIIVFGLLFLSKNENVNKTGILVCDTCLFEDSKCINSGINISKNDLVYVISECKNSYYVQMPVMSIPPTEGYIHRDCVSFNISDFLNANYGVLKSNTVLYNTSSLSAVYSRLESEEVVNILERNGKWILCDFIGGREPKWVESKNITYDLKYKKIR